jgi:hypothetical protein
MSQGSPLAGPSPSPVVRKPRAIKTNHAPFLAAENRKTDMGQTTTAKQDAEMDDDGIELARRRSEVELASVIAKFAGQLMDYLGDEGVKAALSGEQSVVTPDVTPFGQGIADIAAERWLLASRCFPVSIEEPAYRNWCRKNVKDQQAGRLPRFKCRKNGKFWECIKPSVDEYLRSIGIAPR